MSENIFLTQPEFIDLDPRKDRVKRNASSYSVTPEFMFKRHQLMLPAENLKDKSVLDLGSCLSASGAWCLTHGASYYCGVEINEDFARDASFCLEKYYPQDKWEVQRCSIESFLSGMGEPVDVLVASGILYGSADPVTLLQEMSRAADYLVIESMHTPVIFDENLLTENTLQTIAKDPQVARYLEMSSYIAVGPRGMVASGGKSMRFAGLNPSMGAVVYILRMCGFDCIPQPNIAMKRSMPEVYSPIGRYVLHFKRNPALPVRVFGMENAFENPGQRLQDRKWK